MAEIKGIDISYWQGDIDFKKVAADGIKFAILRQGYRNTIDNKFIEYVKGCQENNIYIMVYHFIYTNDATLKQNAESTYDNIKKAGLDPTKIWIAADLEYDTWNKNNEVCTKERCTQYTKQYLEELKKLNCNNLIIYTNNDYYENYYDWSQLKGYPIWFADYSENPKHFCAIHQYSSKGKINGIDGYVDMDYLFDTFMLNTDQDSSDIFVQSIINDAVQYIINIAYDDTHGYDQIYRWNEYGDFDCSSLVISSWQQAGVPVKSEGATYTGNMYNIFLKCGFKDVTDSVDLNNAQGMQYGDVLLNHIHHTAMYIGNNKICEAAINEKGTATGGKPGDQTEQEIRINSYRNYPWDCVLRYIGNKIFNPTKKSISQIAKEVINGKWGNNSIRKQRLQAAGYNYNEIQEKVNELIKTNTKDNKIEPEYAQSFDKSIARSYITTENLRLRAGADTSKTIITTIPKGDTVICYGYFTNNWYYVKYKNYTGFCFKEYLK